jgi:hypothetical protein
MPMKNKRNRIIESEKINDFYKYVRTVQNQNKSKKHKGRYLLINIPYKIVKNLEIREGQDVIIRQSRDINGKRIIVIEPDNIMQTPDKQILEPKIEATTSASKINESACEPIARSSDSAVPSN